MLAVFILSVSKCALYSINAEIHVGNVYDSEKFNRNGLIITTICPQHIFCSPHIFYRCGILNVVE